MSQPARPAVNVREIVRILKQQRRLWVWPTVVLTLVACLYAAVRPQTWRASQALLLRDEAGGALGRRGRFDTSDAMKSAQETIADVVKSPNVLGAALKAAGSDSAGARPSSDEVEALRDRIAVAAPQGTQFGQSEVIYLSVEAPTRERAIALATAVCDALESHLKELRNLRAGSVTGELDKTVKLAQAELDRATAALAAMETEVGSDLGELRILNESGSGDSNLRASTTQIKNELRQAKATHQANIEQQRLLGEAKGDTNRLIATPNRLLESQPALKRLKEGLVDAQLRTAQLAGKFSDDHPEMLAAVAAEEEIRTHLHDELELALRGLANELQVGQSLIASLETQLADVETRLGRLASLRAGYANLVAEVRQRTETLQKNQKELADAQAGQAAAESASLISRIDGPDPGTGPVGPSAAVILLGGAAGGLAIGLGLVLLIAPLGTLRGRRFSDYIGFGRRSTDKTAPPAASPAADRRERRAGSDRRDPAASPQ